MIILLFLAFSCKNDSGNGDNKINKNSSNKIQNVYYGYTLILNAVVKEDDYFLINYITEYEDKKFIKNNVIEVKVNGSNTIQKIEFKIPDDVTELHRLRFNFGRNREQKSVSFKNITIKKNSKELILDIKQIKRFFISNAYLDIDYENGTFTLKENQGEYNPFILSKWSLWSLINKSLG